MKNNPSTYAIRRRCSGTYVLLQALLLTLAMLMVSSISNVAYAEDLNAKDEATNTEANQPEEKVEVDPEANYSFEFIGAKKMLVKVGEEFVDPGAVLLDENRNLLYMFFVYSNEVTILDAEGKRHTELEKDCLVTGTVSTETEGEYLRTISYHGKTLERLVTVLENPEEGLYKPEGEVELVYTLKPKEAYETLIKAGTQLEDPGVEVYDQFWIKHEELEKEVKTTGTIDTSKVKYYVRQYELNGETMNCIFRVVNQKEALVVKYNGKKEVTIQAGKTFKNEGAKVYTKGGTRRQELDKDIVVRGTVNTLKPGDYILIFDYDGVTDVVLVHVERPKTTPASTKNNDDRESGSSSSGSSGNHTEGSNTPGGSNPGGNNPGGNNPGGSNPGGDNPGGNNPGGDNPGGNTPGGDNPGGSNPGGNTPGGNNPGTTNPPEPVIPTPPPDAPDDNENWEADPDTSGGSGGAESPTTPPPDASDPNDNWQ